MATVTQKDETMKTNGEFRFPHFPIGVGLGAVAGVLLASRPGEETRKYFLERSHKSLDYVNDQATKLRRTAEALVEAGKKLMACQHQPIQAATESERQPYEEERREINHFEKQIPPLGFLTRESWSSAAELMRRLLSKSPVYGTKISDWQFILLQSKANGCGYHDKDLPQNNWAWPKDTWFQQRLSRHFKDLDHTVSGSSTESGAL